MANPLDAFSNATIIFTLPAPGIYYDRLGNPHAGYANLNFRAFLKTPPKDSSTKDKDYLGVDQTALELKGYCTFPSILPITIKTGCWYKCNYGIASGWFYLKPFDNFGRAGIDLLVESEIGTAISGFFQTGRVA